MCEHIAVVANVTTAIVVVAAAVAAAAAGGAVAISAVTVVAAVVIGEIAHVSVNDAYGRTLNAETSHSFAGLWHLIAKL